MSPPPTGVPNSERILRDLLAESEAFTGGKKKDLLLAYYEIFVMNPNGRMVLEDIKASFCGISFVPGYSDVTAFREGRRSVGEDIEKAAQIAKAVIESPQP